MAFAQKLATRRKASKIRVWSGVIHMATHDCPEYKQLYETLQYLRHEVNAFRDNRHPRHGVPKPSASSLLLRQKLMMLHSY